MSELDPVIHAPARLRIMTALDGSLERPGDQIAFPALQKQLEMTSGNLTTHLSKLEAAGYIRIDKTFEGRRPVTYLSITPRGRAAFQDYRTTLLKLIGDAS